MPNWTENTIITSKKIFEVLWNKDKDSGCVDFNRVDKMPERLNIESGSLTDMAIIFYITNKLTLNIDSLPKEERETLLTLVSNTFAKDKLSWVKNVFDNTEKYVKDKTLKQKDDLFMLGQNYCFNFFNYGATTWYDWSIDHWGTKWNACESSYEEDGDIVTIFFETAWTPPEPVFEKLIKMFPDEKFIVKTASEDGFIVEYENQKGNLVVTREEQINIYEEP